MLTKAFIFWIILGFSAVVIVAGDEIHKLKADINDLHKRIDELHGEGDDLK